MLGRRKLRRCLKERRGEWSRTEERRIEIVTRKCQIVKENESENGQKQNDQNKGI